MSDKYDDLLNPEAWDIESAEVLPATPKPRAVVSVAFSREDFNVVTNAAESLGVKTSEFIREAALDKAATVAKVTYFAFGSVVHNSVDILHTLTDGTSSHSEPQLVTTFVDSR